MAKRYIIIDGYNYLYAAGMMPRHITPQGLEMARKRLFRFLEGRLSAQERSRTTIVFDVRRNRDLVPGEERAAGMTIYNAVEHDEADSLIEELISRHSAPKQLLVISGDHRLHRAARAKKARAIDSEDFHDQLSNRSRQRGHRNEKPPAPADAAAQVNHSDTEHPEVSNIIPDELAYWEARIRELDDE
ncbi:NYN domain-containing protein [Rubinisphaera sp. JC750]|uniref:NYN domain-containing protein n=1 Tax=Rubinisphaera sp. JC750 TaxID=2898658 RepID=UPI001F351191|nr:NYN domain-containing protein [Rubinisphaera sp. JC750]